MGEDETLTHSATGGGTATVFTYDGDGVRVRKSGYRKYWTGAGTENLAETYDDGNNKREYIYFADKRIAFVDLTVGGGNCSPVCSRYYFYGDHLGSANVMSDGTTLNNDSDYFPFGGERIAKTSNVNPHYKFTGKEIDPEDNLLHFFARDYSSRLGRFMSPDPLAGDITNPQSLNRYAYVLNNPLNFVDPLGLDESSLECVEDDFNTCVNGGVGGGGSFGPGQCAEVFIDGIDVGNTCGGGNGPVGGDGGGGGGGGGDGGNGGGTPTPTHPPQTPTRLECAAQFGQNHSIAAAFGAQNSFVGNLLGGNTISGLVSLGQIVFGNSTPTVGGIATTVLSGGGQGLPGGRPGFKGAAGQASDAAIAGVVSTTYNIFSGVGAQPIELGITAAGNVATPVAQLSTQTLTNVATGVGLAKIAFDLTTFAIGYAKCGQ